MLHDIDVYRLGHKLFNEKYECRANEKELALFRVEEEDVRIISQFDFNGAFSDGSIITSTSPSESMIIDRLFGSPKMTGDEETDAKMLNEIMPVTLTMNEMIEMWEAFRVLRLRNFSDLVTIYNTVTDYVAAVDEYALFSPNYRKPPEEDMIKMRSFLSAISTQHVGIDYDTSGEDDWSVMMKLFNPVGYGDILSPPVMETPKPTPRPLNKPTRKSTSTGDPFDFLK